MPYFPQNHPEFNGLRHLILMYGGRERLWREDDLLPHVAHLDQGGRPDDWLFDSFLFLNARSRSGNDFCADVNLGTTMAGEGDFFAMVSPNPATLDDWRELLEFYLGPDGAVRTLDRTVGTCTRSIGRPAPAKRNVVLMLPYPHVSQRAFGALPGGEDVLDFSTARQNLDRATRSRLAAEQWFVDEIVRRFRGQEWEHVHLLGVYWMFETVYRGWDVDDHWLLKELRRHIRAHGLKFAWIPFWSSYNVHALDDYRSYYFDVAFLQPNYMFYREGKSIHEAARAARLRGAGIEMEYYLELDEPIAITGERHSRFRDYLNGGVTYGYMTGAACAHFQGVGSLERMRTHADPQEREFYEDIYRFVKGSYVVKPPIPREGGTGGPPVALAVDIGGTNIRVALVDAGGTILRRMSHATPSTGAERIDRIRAMLKECTAAAEAAGIAPLGVGVSTGGRVDHERGVVRESTDLLKGWSEIPLAQILTEATGLPVRVDNDGNCAALAEATFGEGRAADDCIVLVVGTGIGGGVVSGGRLLRGAANAAGELGHVSIDADGPPCSCGGRGCVELTAGGSGMARLAAGLMRDGSLRIEGLGPDTVTAEALGKAASRGNKGALEIVEQAGKALGVAVTGYLNAFNPSLVILAGPVSGLGEPWIRSLRATVAERGMHTPRASAEIVLSRLQDHGLLGAAAMIFRERPVRG